MDIFIESKKENGRGPAALQLGPFAECCYAFQSRTGIIGDTGGGRREKNCGFSSSSFSLQTTRPIRGPRWLIVSTTVKGGKNALLELAANQQVEKQTHTRWRGVASSQLFFFPFFLSFFPPLFLSCRWNDVCRSGSKTFLQPPRDELWCWDNDTANQSSDHCQTLDPSSLSLFIFYFSKLKKKGECFPFMKESKQEIRSEIRFTTSWFLQCVRQLNFLIDIFVLFGSLCVFFFSFWRG